MTPHVVSDADLAAAVNGRAQAEDAIYQAFLRTIGHRYSLRRSFEAAWIGWQAATYYERERQVRQAEALHAEASPEIVRRMAEASDKEAKGDG